MIMIFQKEFFEKVSFKKNQQTTLWDHVKISSMYAWSNVKSQFLWYRSAHRLKFNGGYHCWIILTLYFLFIVFSALINSYHDGHNISRQFLSQSLLNLVIRYFLRAHLSLRLMMSYCDWSLSVVRPSCVRPSSVNFFFKQHLLNHWSKFHIT